MLDSPAYPRRVLIVDENRDAADSLALTLRRLGHYVRVVYDGESAITTALQMRPDVVFLDIVMPGVDGFEVARRLRAEEQFRRLLIVAVTGLNSEEDRVRSRDAGIDHFLVKPPDLDFLKSLLGRRR